MTDLERIEIEDFASELMKEQDRKTETLSKDILMFGTAVIDLLPEDYNE